MHRPLVLLRAIALTAILSLLTAPAFADEADTFALAVFGVDTAIPSVWAEFQGGEPVRALLVWSVAPIDFRLFGVGKKVQTKISGQCRETRAVDVFLIPFVEPQVRPASTAYRLAFGASLPIVAAKPPVGFHADGGWLMGSDGSGWFAGGGVTLGPSSFAPWGFRLGLTFRWYQLTDTARGATGFDFTTALYPKSWGRILGDREIEPIADVCSASPAPSSAPESPKRRPDDEFFPPKGEQPTCDRVRVECSEMCGVEVSDGCGGTIRCPPCDTPLPLPRPDDDEEQEVEPPEEHDEEE